MSRLASRRLSTPSSFAESRQAARLKYKKFLNVSNVVVLYFLKLNAGWNSYLDGYSLPVSLCLMLLFVMRTASSGSSSLTGLNHGLINYKDTKTICRLYWCFIKFKDGRDSESCCCFRPSFVNYCPSNLLSGSPPPPLPFLCESTV